MHLRFFTMSIIISICVFMLSLHSIINQPYLIVLFVFVGYLMDYSKIDNDPFDFMNKTNLK